MSIFRIRLPIKSKTVLYKTKQICLKSAIMDAKRNFYSLRGIQEEIRTKFEQAGLSAVIDYGNVRMATMKESLRKKYIKKLKWVFKWQIKGKKVANFKLEDVITIIGDIQIPVFVEEVLKKGRACALLKDTVITDDIPIVDIKKSERTRTGEIEMGFYKTKDGK